MNKRTVFSMVLFIAICIVATIAFADEKQEEKPGKAWADEGEVSFVNTGGNTQVTSLAAKNQLKYKFSDKLLATWKLGAVYAKDHDVKTAENYFTDLKVDYLFTEKFYSLADAGWLQNKFVGIDQRLYGGLGVGYKFLTGPAHFLVGELGLHYVSDSYTDGTNKDYPAGRAFGKYTYAFTEKNKAYQSLEFLYDFNDSNNYDVNSETAIISALNGSLSMKTAYTINYRNAPVPSTLKKTDTMLMVALVVNY
jgi:putative salt-induced outer membrane protein YdiY